MPVPSPLRGTCGHGCEAGAPERQLEDLGAHRVAELAHRRHAALGGPRLLHHDHVGVEAAQGRVEVVGLAHAVAAGLQAGVAVEAGDLQLGHGSITPVGHWPSTVRGHAAGQAQRRAGAAEVAVGDRHGAAVALGDGPDHGEAETDATGVAGAPFVEAREALEHPLAVLADAGTVVVDDEHATVVRRREPEATGRAAWRAALSSEVAHHPLSWSRRPCTRPADTRPVSTGRVAAARCSSSTRSSRSTSGSVAIGPDPRPRRGAPGRAGRSTGLHALVLGQRALRDLGPVGAVGVAQRDLELGADRATGLRSSCDASETNARCFCADVSSRSSIPFIVRASRPTSSSVPARHPPVQGRAGDRPPRRGWPRPARSARPVKHHAGERHQQDQQRARRSAGRR